MTEALGTRDRIVHTTSKLMQRQGYAATGIKQIATEASATLGSVYHFFPGGKQELAVAAIRHADAEFAEMLTAILAKHPDPGEAVYQAAAETGVYLRDTGWAEGCPVTATALETAGQIPEIQQACVETFAHWESIIFEKLKSNGFAEGLARELAGTVLHALSGAEVSAQVKQDVQPLETAGRHMQRLINSYR
ncbi:MULTISPECIES: TetR/AcrR family transcriptional regulator [unclassified Crossiella]|uniref:TetR/AcrR family transcriptional regulator n=1 Tax=unclassified Crossiella TaxID=2620835 RepID=UPI001FFE3E3B|nr:MULTISPECIES: TetR/AcrR family transcriptional regulator [unclassified Crossiella]MCK2240572.1 TetR/AcrR family transcriptional regulator [Crossiella sp. S99.2]MCK2252977.1 TetR/AcrR family transcriptional regulator [Crossiella sp. S99.1]